MTWEQLFVVDVGGLKALLTTGIVIAACLALVFGMLALKIYVYFRR